MVDSGGKIKEFLNKVAKERLIINCKRKYMVVSKRDSPKYELGIGDIKINSARKLNFVDKRLIHILSVVI